MKRRLERVGAIAGALTVALVIAACAGGPDRPKPQPLQPLTPQEVAAPAWSQRIGAVQFPLTAAIARGSVTVAASDGTVSAFELDTGKELWRASAGTALGAGVGSDGRFAAVVTRGAELVTLEAGQVKWRKALGTRVSTAPLVAGERVFVLGVDRSVQAFDALDGRKLWSLPRQGDPLTLSQPGVLAAFKDTLVVGQGPRMVGLDPLGGTTRWDVALASPRGANEVERLADLVGPAARVGNVLCARAFQAAVGCVDGDRGTLPWSRNVGGTDAVGADADYVFGADASDRMSAWRVDGGVVAWTSEALLYRGLSAPAAHGRSVVYGDSEGLLHWLARSDGHAQLRLPTDGSGLAGPPVSASGMLLVVTRAGGLYAFRAR
ncbi:MAG: PQQ-binding-like beta-propeller repeat protein [Rhizobacter sp.]